MHEEDVVGAKRAIDHQLADPMAVRLLLAQEIFCASRMASASSSLVVRRGGAASRRAARRLMTLVKGKAEKRLTG